MEMDYTRKNIYIYRNILHCDIYRVLYANYNANLLPRNLIQSSCKCARIYNICNLRLMLISHVYIYMSFVINILALSLSAHNIIQVVDLFTYYRYPFKVLSSSLHVLCKKERKYLVETTLGSKAKEHVRRLTRIHVPGCIIQLRKCIVDMYNSGK